MRRIMAARVAVLNCEVKRRKVFKHLILLRFPMHGAITCAGGARISRVTRSGFRSGSAIRPSM